MKRAPSEKKAPQTAAKDARPPEPTTQTFVFRGGKLAGAGWSDARLSVSGYRHFEYQARRSILPDPNTGKYWVIERRGKTILFGGGDHVMLDLQPAKGGTAGQIIEYWNDAGARGILAPSFRRWLERIADDLDAGKHVYNAEERTVMPRAGRR